MTEDFIHLSTGTSINRSHISLIDFSKPAVMVFVGASAITVEGEDAATLRELFGREELEGEEGADEGEAGEGATAAKRNRKKK